jgi:hypothetical protein
VSDTLSARPPAMGRGWRVDPWAPRCGSVASGPSRHDAGMGSVGATACEYRIRRRPPAAAPRPVRAWTTDVTPHATKIVSGYTRVEDVGSPVAVAPGRRWPGDRVGGCVKKCVRPHPPYRGRGGVRPLGTALGVPSKRTQRSRLHGVDRNAPQDTAPHHAGAGERFTNIATAKKGRAALPPPDTPVPWPSSSLRWGVSPWTRPPRREGDSLRSTRKGISPHTTRGCAARVYATRQRGVAQADRYAALGGLGGALRQRDP